MAYRKDIRRSQSGFAIGKTTEKATSLKIISGDLCGRNDLKSKVSTLEELYDFFSKVTQKLHRRCDFWSCRHSVDRLNYFLFYHNFFSHSIHLYYLIYLFSYLYNLNKQTLLILAKICTTINKIVLFFL